MYLTSFNYNYEMIWVATYVRTYIAVVARMNYIYGNYTYMSTCKGSNQRSL